MQIEVYKREQLILASYLNESLFDVAEGNLHHVLK
jgi:hypothetical protein